MSGREQWQSNNDAYLAAALEWIRLRLARLAGHTPAPAAGPHEKHNLCNRLFGGAPAALTSPDAPGDKEISRAREAMDKYAATEPPPAAIILKRRFELSDFELETLLLCASIELDTRGAGLCARAHGDPLKAYPTYALALALFEKPVWEALSPERPLRFWRLIDISQPAATPLTASPLRADERIVNYLKGLNHLDDRLTLFVSPLIPPGGSGRLELPPSQQKIAAALAQGLSKGTIPTLIHLLGHDSGSKQLIASEAGARLSLALYHLPADLLPNSPAELEHLSRLWRRETVLLPIALYLDAKESERDLPPVTRFLARSNGLVILDTRENWRNLRREALTLDIERPTRAEQHDAWQERVCDETLAGVLASQFHLSVPEIDRVAAAAARTQEGSLEDRLWEACRAASRPKLDLLAQRIEPKATWEDLVLPELETEALREIAAQARGRYTVYDDWGFGQRVNRGLGISALFSGESGTGKTMAAEVVANELKLNLYRIDLSAVVSKYIGETEKNLRQVFDAAEDGGTILFFDEADALFGKRSEVKDSHDRYANIEINYLLQRMEAYSGLAILATNLKSALDTAFLRRLRFIVQFPFPGVAERKRIWQRAFPAAVPKLDLDFDFLARLNVAGGTIHNIALRAAFIAARKGEPVSMGILLEAARAEFHKLERPVNESEFRWQDRKTGAAA
jgi:ATPase family protein associated with various cellular activities (AAA)/winged helix domain-containing protein